MKYLVLFAWLATAITAAPTAPTKGTIEWTPTLAGYFDVVFQYIQQARAVGAAEPKCDLSSASMAIAPTPLPPPAGLTLEHVAVGRGVQVSIFCRLPLQRPRIESHRTIHVPMPPRRLQQSAPSHDSTTLPVWRPPIPISWP